MNFDRKLSELSYGLTQSDGEGENKGEMIWPDDSLDSTKSSFLVM